VFLFLLSEQVERFLSQKILRIDQKMCLWIIYYSSRHRPVGRKDPRTVAEVQAWSRFRYNKTTRHSNRFDGQGFWRRITKWTDRAIYQT